MADTRFPDRRTVQVSYRVLRPGGSRPETRIFSNLRGQTREEEVSRLMTCLRREHPGCDIRLESVEQVLTGSR